MTPDINILMARALQTDNMLVPGQPANTANPGLNGNHNGGPILFGPDGKLYVYLGDQGRRGWMQNLANGPFLNAPFVDDTYGGPAPDNAHLSGVVLRLNTDGSAPTDNPFYAAGTALGGEVGANIRKVFSYGHRNGFGMAFDPYGSDLWVTENGDDTFSEINRVEAGLERRLDPDHGSAAPVLRLQGDRGHPIRRCAPAGAVPSDPPRRRPGRRAGARCSCCPGPSTWILS